MTEITLSAFVVTLVVGYLIPLVTAVLTKINASATLKQLVTAVLAAINGFVVNATVQDGSAVFTTQALLFAVLSFLTANVGYVAVWKPHSIDARIVPDRGLGRAA